MNEPSAQLGPYLEPKPKPLPLKELLTQAEVPCRDCRTTKRIVDMNYHVGLDGMPYYLCFVCEAKSFSERQRKEVALKIEEGVNKAVEKTTKELVRKINAAHISELNEDLMELFGGHKEFARFYFNEMMKAAAAERQGGNKRALDACATVIRLVTESTKHRQSAPDVEELDDHQIEVEVRKILRITEDRAG